MRLFEKSPEGPVSGGIIIGSCTSKIAEMNDSDRELFKTSKNFEIGSVEKKLEMFWFEKTKNFSKILNFRHRYQLFSFKNCPRKIEMNVFAPISVTPISECKKNIVWLFSLSFDAFDLIFGVHKENIICNIEKNDFFEFFSILEVVSLKHHLEKRVVC